MGPLERPPPCIHAGCRLCSKLQHGCAGMVPDADKDRIHRGYRRPQRGQPAGDRREVIDWQGTDRYDWGGLHTMSGMDSMQKANPVGPLEAANSFVKHGRGKPRSCMAMGQVYPWFHEEHMVGAIKQIWRFEQHLQVCMQNCSSRWIFPDNGRYAWGPSLSRPIVPLTDSSRLQTNQ